MIDEDDRLCTYGAELAAAGFDVWFTPSSSGYLTYRAPDQMFWGTLQHSDHNRWQHLMPLKPSRKHGSYMFLDTVLDPFTVEAAIECARAVNYNSLVGWQDNARTAHLSPRAVSLNQTVEGKV